jgi:Zn-dependent peptidase ImmA (M78 family)
LVEGLELSPEQAADAARQNLGVGEIARLDDLLLLIEGAGVPIVVAKMPGGPDGIYLRSRGVPFILVNSDVFIIERARFTLAHEFGHHSLGHGDVWDQEIRSDDRHPKERAANLFASEFLVPRAAVDWWFKTHDDPEIDLETLVRFAHHFRVSCPMARYRLENTKKLTSRRQIKELDEAIAARTHGTLALRLGLTTPSDSLTLASAQSVRVPQKMKARILWALSQGQISEELAATRLRLTQEQLADELQRETFVSAVSENNMREDSVVASRE